MSTTKHSPIALITGGSRGLGRSMALHLAQRGSDLLLTYRTGEREAAEVVNQVVALGQKAVALPLDVADSTSFAGFVDSVRAALTRVWQRDQLDHLVNNAGTGVHAAFADTAEAQLDELYRIHFKAPYLLSQQLLPLIADGGSILNVSSGLTRITFPGYSAYAALKGSVEVLSRYMAKELGGRGIRVNTIAPGAIETDFGGGHVRDDAGLNAVIAGMTALGRVGLPDDIGAAVAMLLAPESGWISGQRVEVSGGQGI
jgi:NAD(P)-dependent dehydrogenase (short-subunit alcohol dehydrogenase family)